MGQDIKGLFPITQAAEVCGLSRILQIQQFQSMGFDYEETAIYFAVRFPSCRVLSVLVYGDYSRLDEAWLTLGREAKKRGLTPAAPPRAIGIVAPYTGREIDPGKYCSRIVMPVAEEQAYNLVSFADNFPCFIIPL